jgi:predicted RNase H-like HicB family nuclease
MPNMPLLDQIHATISLGEDSGYVAECREIAVMTQGQTLDEITLNLREAVELYLEDERIPPDRLVIALNFLEQLSPSDRNPNANDYDLSAMANDPEIQAEIAAIGQEFGVADADLDGLAA